MRETHDPGGGVLLPVADVAAAAFDPSGAPRDGVTVSRGEPFFQPNGLLALVRSLRERGCHHLLVYSGYRLGALRRRAAREPAVGALLAAVDVLMDGPYVAARGRHQVLAGQREPATAARRRGATGRFR